uniref:uncharacterized protein LOC104266784 n=1 Tax=Ciona intestinalis TaxID=7719 RepID=UPI0005219A1A|nr:uncharacterized protein LOC104266784 [Ciona intestinalis]|eukprot:XP_009862095.1 uncharacterized protein LOC104266784 [Ciona intestinalis]
MGLREKERAAGLGKIFFKYLTPKECDTIIKDLVKQKLVCEDHGKRSKNAVEKLATLLNKSEEKWDKALIAVIKKLGKEKLSKVIRTYLKSDDNDALVWLVQNWPSANSIYEVLWILPDIPPTDDNPWLEVAWKLCVQNHSMLYDLCVLYLYHNTSNHVAGNYYPTFEKLKFMQDMIANSLTPGGCKDLVQKLYEKEYITKDKNKKIQNCKTNKEMMEALSKHLKKGKPHFQAALNTAIQSQGVDHLSQVVEGCFSSKNKICLLWIATQWEVLFANKGIVYNVTTKRGVEHISNLEKSGSFWLLHILLRLRTMDANLARKFVKELLMNMKQFVVDFGVNLSSTTSTTSTPINKQQHQHLLQQDQARR